MSSTRNNAGTFPDGTGAPLSDRFDASGVTADGAAWLASAGTYPRSTLALWEDRPTAPVVLPCGTAFDVVNVPAIFGRRMLDRLWDEGPGSGPVAVFRGRMLLFSSPGTAQRLPSLLEWEEWGARGAGGSRDTREPGTLGGFGAGIGGIDGAGGIDEIAGFDAIDGIDEIDRIDGFRDPREPLGRRGGPDDARPSGGTGGPACPDGLGRVGAIPPLLCHGTGDAVTVPALRDGDPVGVRTPGDSTGGTGPDPATRPESRWLVAPDTRHPWLPGAEILVWAAVRAARAAASAAVRISIFPPADQGAKVYDVSRRR
ncbi:bifunctional DNA primase/polymerase [Streptomyces fagopyri]|uniref:bifunctional DNA primase/polymerase n=1 Tax=Streptomyces fagopyri TaxID=2662397 RepID=UPI001D175ACD|nr:bifunctional DNA primase/polymerase [Streptomyces fagopyri]